MKKVNLNLSLFTLITVIILIGCTTEKSNSREEKSQLDSNSTTSTNQQEKYDNALFEIKFYASLMNTYTRLDYHNREVRKITENLNDLAVQGYKLHGYDEGIEVLGFLSHDFSVISKSFEEMKAFDQLFEWAEMYDEDLSDLENIFRLTTEAIKEHKNAYEQIELYLETDNSTYIEKYYTHKVNNYNLTTEAISIAVKNQSDYYFEIMEY